MATRSLVTADSTAGWGSAIRRGKRVEMGSLHGLCGECGRRRRRRTGTRLRRRSCCRGETCVHRVRGRRRPWTRIAVAHTRHARWVGISEKAWNKRLSYIAIVQRGSSPRKN